MAQRKRRLSRWIAFQPQSESGPPSVSETALELSQKLLYGPVLEGHLRVHALELFVLRLELFEAFHVGRLHAAVLASPLVEGRRTDAPEFDTFSPILA